MASAILTICVSALFLQIISVKCRVNPGLPMAVNPETFPNKLANMPYAAIPAQAAQYIPENAAVFNGGGLKVTSFSSIGPTGIKVLSDKLAVEGPLSVTGKLPFLSVVTFEGSLPAIGQGTVAYECGNGKVGIVSESVGEGLGFSAGLTGLGYNAVANGLAVGRY